ncbi:hypothetical protein F5051DRAFT_430158 [Lentinula edodes]|nr:hypothetical protein F5051DRAFT_430158 [Lentinula edodes]
MLDGVSYGMIIFPTSAPFTNLGPIGVFVFFVSGSGFAGANGSMMMEVVPFYHMLAASIAQNSVEDKPAQVIATTIVAYALSSVLTSLSFFVFGALKLGTVIGFFLRPILVGCIGGVSTFLIETGTSYFIMSKWSHHLMFLVCDELCENSRLFHILAGVKGQPKKW